MDDTETTAVGRPEGPVRRVQGGRGAPALALLLLAVYLSPALSTGFLFDDAFTSSIRGLVGMAGTGFFRYSFDSMVETVRISGRGLPLLFLTGFGTFYVSGHHALAYKWWLLLLTVAAAAAFWLMLREFHGPDGERPGHATRTASLALLLAVPCLQIRTYHDPIVAYFGLMQFMLILLCGAAILFLRWLRQGRRGPLWGAVALFAVGCLLYEMTPLFAVLFVALGLHERLRPDRALRAALPFLATAGLFVLVVLAERSIADIPHEAYAPTFHLGEIARSFAVQLTSTVPLTFYVFDPLDHLPNLATSARAVLPAMCAVGALGSVAAWAALPRSDRTEDEAASTTRPYGYWPLAALLLVPAGALSYVTKYQVELTWGFGYLQVFVQAFALGAIVAGGLARRRALALPAVRAVVAIAFGVLVAFGYAANRSTAEILDQVDDSRQAVEQAARAGAFDGIRDGTTIHVPADWINPPFFYQVAGKRVQTTTSAPPTTACDPTTAEHVVVTVSREGQVALACPLAPPAPG